MKILVVQIGRYGDLILTTPLLFALKQEYPDAELHVLAHHRYSDLLENQHLVDVVHVYRKNVMDVLQSFLSLRSAQFELYIDPKDHFSQESTFFARAIRSHTSVGFNAPGKVVFNLPLPSAGEFEAHTPPLHVVDRNLYVMTLLGKSFNRRRPYLEYTQERRLECLRMAPPYKEGVLMLVLNISAGQASREWPVDHWISLAQQLAVRGQRLQILAAPNDHAKAMHIAAAVGERAQAYCSSSIHQAFALIDRAQLLITPDSAPVHIASAFNTPCVALFNSISWNLHKFKPLSDVHRVVQPRHEGDIADIGVDDVLAAAREVLDEVRNRPSQETRS